MKNSDELGSIISRILVVVAAIALLIAYGYTMHSLYTVTVNTGEGKPEYTQKVKIRNRRLYNFSQAVHQEQKVNNQLMDYIAANNLKVPNEFTSISNKFADANDESLLILHTDGSLRRSESWDDDLREEDIFEYDAHTVGDSGTPNVIVGAQVYLSKKAVNHKLRYSLQYVMQVNNLLNTNMHFTKFKSKFKTLNKKLLETRSEYLKDPYTLDEDYVH